MIYCRSCGKEIEKGDAFCGECGQKIMLYALYAQHNSGPLPLKSIYKTVSPVKVGRLHPTIQSEGGEEESS